MANHLKHLDILNQCLLAALDRNGAFTFTE